MPYALLNGRVTDDVTWPQRCCETVRSAILETAWLLVTNPVDSRRESAFSCTRILLHCPARAAWRIDIAYLWYLWHTWDLYRPIAERLTDLRFFADAMIQRLKPTELPMQWAAISTRCRESNTSHAHTVVWECCKDDRQSQWEMAKFDPQPTLNPWTDRHQIWNTWLRRDIFFQKNWAQSAQGILPLIYPKYTPKTFESLLHFLKFFRRSTDALVGPIFTLNTSFDVDLRKVVPFEG